MNTCSAWKDERTHTHTRTHMHPHMNTYVPTQLHTYTCSILLCIHAYIHTYLLTHIQTITYHYMYIPFKYRYIPVHAITLNYLHFISFHHDQETTWRPPRDSTKKPAGDRQEDTRKPPGDQDITKRPAEDQQKTSRGEPQGHRLENARRPHDKHCDQYEMPGDHQTRRS